MKWYKTAYECVAWSQLFFMGKMKCREKRQNGNNDGGILFLLHFSTFQILHFHSFMFFCMFQFFFNEHFFLCWMVCIHVFLISSLKVQFTQEQLFSQIHRASSTQTRNRTSTQTQNRHWVLRSPLLLLSWYCSPKGQPFSWLLIACFTLKHNFTWINSNSFCIQLTNNANLKTYSIYNV